MFVMFFLMFMLIYGALSFYVGYNGWIWLSRTFSFRYKKTYSIIIVFLSASIIIGQFSNLLPLKLLGYGWFLIVGYGLVLLPITNLLYYLVRKKGILWFGISIIAVYLFVFVYGSFNAWNPVVRSYEIEIDKEIERDELKIVMASDFHLGSIVGKKHLQKFVNLVEQENPDIVLIPGDLIDDYLEPFLEKNMAEVMGKIKAPLGVYATLGNHDYYGNDVEEIIKTMEDLGIEMLTDDSVLINDEFYIIGRNDDTDDTRKTIDEIVKRLDKTKPLIMLDHQPNELDAAQENGVDLILSGHTHRGQVAPANIITNMIYENDYGYLQKGNLHSIVSSGFGTWGPPLRIGTRSEVMVITLKFD